MENPTNEDREARLFYHLTIDTNTDEIIDRLSFDSFAPGARIVGIPDLQNEKLYIYYYMGEPNDPNDLSHDYVYDLVSKQKSKTLIGVERAIGMLSYNAKHIVFTGYDYAGPFNGKICTH